MKKLFSFLTLASVTGAMALGAASLSPKDNSFVNVSADGGVEKYIPVNKTDFFQEGWNDDWGFVKTNVNETYWVEGYSYQAMDAFFDGCGWGSEVRESWTGVLNSRKWTQTTQYIYFTYGCARDFDIDPVNNPVKLVVHCDNELEGDSHVTKTYDVWNNTFCGVAMVFRYFKLSDEDFAALGNSFKMWIEFIDQRENAYGANVFGWLHVNQTWDEVQDAGSRYYNAVRYPNQNGEAKIKSQFANNADLAAINITDLNESFDDQEDFLRNFTYDTTYGNNDWMDGRHPDRAISTASVRGGGADDTNMPYNKTGLGLFRGWFDEGPGGYVGSDKPTYRFVSREFVLKGTGLISIKMAGHGAQLQVIDVTNDNALTKYDLTTFVSGGDEMNMATVGNNQCTMVRHFINLNNLVGHTLKVAIADEAESDWGAVYFDELITRYDTYADVAFKVDSVVQSNKTGNHYLHFEDKFLTKITDDSTAAKKAHDFITSYFSTCRNASNHYNRCSVNPSSLITAYNSLSDDARAIVDASEDFDGSNRTGEQAWYDYEIFKGNESTGAYTVGGSMQHFISRQNAGNQQLFYMQNLGNSSTVAILIVISSAIILCAGIILLKKKHNK